LQSQQFVPAFDLNVSPKWEINFGVGVGVTAGTDHMLVKAIIGRRFDWGKRHGADTTFAPGVGPSRVTGYW